MQKLKKLKIKLRHRKQTPTKPTSAPHVPMRS